MRQILVNVQKLLLYLKVVLSQGFIFVRNDAHPSVVGLPVPLLLLGAFDPHGILVIVRLNQPHHFLSGVQVSLPAEFILGDPLAGSKLSPAPEDHALAFFLLPKHCLAAFGEDSLQHQDGAL